jgi:glycosyltransferase involved in cell wall biosynthesis
VVRFVYTRTDTPLDGIRRYTERSCEALQMYAGVSAQVDFWTSEPAANLAQAGDVLVVQYNPFSYGRRGFAPWLVRRLRQVRRQVPGARILLMVHEAYVPARSVKWAVMGTWQQAQLAAVARAAHGTLVSTPTWFRRVARLAGVAPIAAIPVGSNLPDARSARTETRRAHGWADDVFVVAALGGDRAARLPDFAERALTTIVQSRPHVVFANLGAAPLELPKQVRSVAQYQPGAVDEEALANELAAADLFLAPYEDGVSLRRTTLAAALQHGLPVVGTSGRNTEAELSECAALRLAPRERIEDFAAVAAEVSIDREGRTALRVAARQYFEERLSWPTIADQYRRALEVVVGGPIV